jgi:hypothetical protein
MKVGICESLQGNWPVFRAVVCYLLNDSISGGILFLALKEKWSRSHRSSQSEIIFFLSCHQSTGQYHAILKLLINSLKMWQSLNI